MSDVGQPAPRPRLRPPRKVVGIVGVLLLVLVVRLVWGYYTAAALQAQVKQIRDRGEPLEAADFAFVPLSDSDNAAKFEMDAARAFVSSAIPPRASSNVYPSYIPYDAKWMADAGASEQAHGKLFALAREARRHPRAQWHNAPVTSALNTLTGVMPSLNGARNLANTVGDGAEYAHLTGNDPEALERVRDILHLSRCIAQDDAIVPQLVSIGIDALACNAAMSIASGLRLEPSAPDAPATRDSARALIAELLNDEPMRDGLARSFRFERALAKELRERDAQGTWLVRPLAEAQLVRDYRNFDIYLAVTRLPNRPQMAAAIKQLSPERAWEGNDKSAAILLLRDVPRYSRWFGTNAYLDRYVETWCRVLAERRMTAASLAAQLFRADHGRWPQQLDELAPAYLPAVPLDPFADGAPLGYVIQHGVLPGGADRPLVFQRNGEIDYGPYPEPSYSWESDRRPGVTIRKDLWQYRDLSRFTPPPASTEAVEDEP